MQKIKRTMSDSDRAAISSVVVSLALFAQAAQAFYNPETGRWLSRDPIGERGGRNLNGFNFNNPVTRTDPLGKNCLDVCGFAQALNWDLDENGRHAAGTVVCCGGRKYACIFDAGLPPLYGNALKIWIHCAFEHEWEHYKHIQDCPICSEWPTKSRFKTDRNAAECAAYDATIKCLEAALARGDCGDDPLCEKLIRDGSILEAKEKRDKFCKDAKYGPIYLPVRTQP